MKIRKNRAGETVLSLPTTALHDTAQIDSAQTAQYVQAVYEAFLRQIGIRPEAHTGGVPRHADRNVVTIIEINLGVRPPGESLSQLRDTIEGGLQSTLNDQRALNVIDRAAGSSMRWERGMRFESLGIPDPGLAPACRLR